MTQPLPVIATPPDTFYTTLQLARWSGLPHPQVASITQDCLARQQGLMGDNWPLLRMQIQACALCDDAGALHEGYVLARHGLLHVLHDLPDSPRVQKLREIAGRVMFSHILGGMADELAAAFDAQAAQAMDEEAQP